MTEIQTEGKDNGRNRQCGHRLKQKKNVMNDFREIREDVAYVKQV